MSTPPASPWGPPSGDQDQPNPYAAPDDASPGGSTPPTDPATGYPAAPAPSGYEARRPGEGTAPVPPPYGSSAQSPYGQPGYGSPTPPGYGAQTPYGPGPYGPDASSPYGPGTTYPYPGGAPTPPPGTWGQQQRPTDGLAIASLITSGAGLFTAGLSGPVGLGLGIGALRRIRRNDSGGRGLAIAGIVVGAFFTVVLFAVAGAVAWALTQSASYWEERVGSSDASSWWQDGSDSDDTDAWNDSLPAYELPAGFVAGDCFADYPQTYDMSDGVVVDCAQPHDGEIVALIDMTGPVTTDLTTADPVADIAWDACTAQLTALLGADAETVGLQDVFFPHPDQWEAGQRTAYCMLVTTDWVSGSLVAGSWAPPAGPSTT